MLSVISSTAFGQTRALFSELELQRDGKYYRINTIPPFSGVAYDIHPPVTEKQKQKAKLDYNAYLRSAQKKEEVTFKNGVPDGKAVGWDEYGQKVYEATFVAGVQQGLERQWYPNGKNKAEANYQDGEIFGMTKQWFDNGNRQFEGVFENGKEEGLHVWWFKSGGKDQEVDYANGNIEGFVRNWYENGEMRLEARFENNLANGTSTEWYDNGQKKGEGSYKDGKEEGTFHTFSRKGKLLDELVYKQGELKIERDFRNASIRAKEGFVYIFNEKNTFFTVNIDGANVRPVKTGNITFIVDRKIIQLLSVEASGALDPNQSSDPILREAMKAELTNIIKDLKAPVETESSLSKTSSGIPYMYWSFTNPKASKDPSLRGVLEEHFITLLVNDQILHLSSAVTNKDRPEAIRSLLQNVANTVKISENRIDLNQVRKAVLGNQNCQWQHKVRNQLNFILPKATFDYSILQG